MKKIYSLVLMAVILLVGTNAWAAQVRNVGTAEQFETAWKALQNGDEIRLTGNVSVGKTLWLGTTTMADLNPMSITLNLNGHKLTGTADKMFVITHGELNVISENGEGVIEHTAGQGKMSSTYEIFRVLGSTYKDVDPKNLGENQKYYSHLTIGENVKLIASNNAVVVDQANTVYPTSSNAWAAGNVTIPSTDAAKQKLYTNVYRSDRGVAHGVCIDIKGKIEAQKYAIKANGNLGVPANHIDATYPKSYHYQDRNNAAYEIVEGEQNVYSPFIHIHSSAELLTKNFTSTAAIAAYSGGYSRWLVEGTCIGSTGVYVKSGELVINNAVVASNYTGTYQPAGESERSSGVDAGGSGIVMETAKAYAGEMDVTVQGDTKVSGTVGYAIDEAVSPKSDSTKVDAITITGGTFESGDQGTMRVTEITAEANLDPTQETIITIIGGSADNTSTTIGNQSLVEFLSDQAQEPGKETHITYVENEEGKTVMVISQGEAPVTSTKVSNAADGASVKWQGPLYVSDTIKADLRVAELEINDTITAAEALANPSLTAGTPREQILVINDGVKFEASRVILGKGAKIIVEAGGKFIVTGAQGIVAPSDHNIVLKASESQQAYFIFHPSVTSNRHPNATVEFSSKGYYVSNSDFANQRFGLPMFDGLDSITTKYNNADVATGFGAFDGNDWVVLGFINMTPALNLEDMAEPFTYYQMQHNAPEMGTMVRMYGKLYGNTSPELNIKASRWNAFANSFSAPIDGQTLINLIPNSVDKTFYLYDITKDQAVWKSYTLLNINMQGGIRPMQPFLIRNTKGAANVTVDYQQAVYNPAITAAAGAPARHRTLDDITKAELIVSGENGADYVLVAENDQFTAEFDNGYDAAKYMNDGINMYISANEKMSIFATDNLENTYVGFQAVKGGNYTIEFANVQGEDLILIDLETGARVAMVEGGVYEFTADANSVNDYRFQITKINKVATDIENTEAVKSAKGIYTITGQYVGEMNVWNTLPAGVYVVNGEKCVK